MPTLMVSISGVRGIVGDGLDPEVTVKYTNAYADFVSSGKVVVGRDARISGEMVNQIVTGTLLSRGIDVIDLGIVPTPTVLFNVKALNANGGIAITASHNPNEWNALKLLNSSGRFMSPAEHEIMKNYLGKISDYKSWNEIGKRSVFAEGLHNHINAILSLPVIDLAKIRSKKFKVVADCVNGAGAWCIPDLLRLFGCEVIEMNCNKSGIFPRLPEPIPENLTETMKAVRDHNADFAVVVDPDVDRLVLITDKGEPFSEENTITQAVRFILSKVKGNVVVNLSTTRAVDDISNEFGCRVFRSPVGEANVVEKMIEADAVIGGEGSGGVIYPELLYGRDALVGIAITLQHLTEINRSLSELKDMLPKYHIAKRKIDLGTILPDQIISALTEKYIKDKINTDDGLRVDYDDHWIHFRKSNTEPIIRIITEAGDKKLAEEYSERYVGKIREMIQNMR